MVARLASAASRRPSRQFTARRHARPIRRPWVAARRPSRARASARRADTVRLCRLVQPMGALHTMQTVAPLNAVHNARLQVPLAAARCELVAAAAHRKPDDRGPQASLLTHGPAFDIRAMAGVSLVPVQMWQGVSPVRVQMRPGWAQSRCRCARGEPQPPDCSSTTARRGAMTFGTRSSCGWSAHAACSARSTCSSAAV